MSEVLNPVDLENQIRKCANRIADSVSEVSRREAEASRLRREYDVANAHATLKADAKNAEARKAQATLETVYARAAAEDAEIAFRYAQRSARALEKELDALRSIGVSVRQMYGSAGRGEY